MLHENDPAKHGCEFGVFFDGRTPTELMQEGIYTALALALYPGEFQATSIRVRVRVGVRVRVRVRVKVRVGY